MQNTKKLFFTAILAVATLTTNNSNCAARPTSYDAILYITDITGDLGGRVIRVPVNDTDTVANLKRKIRDQYEIPIEKQLITGQGAREVNDTVTMREILPGFTMLDLFIKRENTEQRQQRQQQQREAAPAPHYVTQLETPKPTYPIGAKVVVDVKNKPKEGIVTNFTFVEGTGVYTVSFSDDKNRSFFEGEISLAPEPRLAAEAPTADEPEGWGEWIWRGGGFWGEPDRK